MKIGIIGGSFDPIHNGHINMATIAYKKLNLDIVYFMPNNQSPHKNLAKATSYQRYRMIQLAIKNLPFAKICTSELDCNNFSYTVDTINKLYNPKNQLFFIIGSDTLEIFHSFRDYEKILQKTQLVCIKRDENIKSKHNAIMIENKILEISSSNIKSDINKSDVKQSDVQQTKLDKNVYEYIKRNGIY